MLKPPFPETTDGQTEWLEAVNEIVLDIPDGLGKGVFWWEPMSMAEDILMMGARCNTIINALEKYALPCNVQTDRLVYNNFILIICF